MLGTPHVAPRARRTGLEMLAGLTVLTSGLSRQVWGRSAASELRGAWPVDDLRARGATLHMPQKMCPVSMSVGSPGCQDTQEPIPGGHQLRARAARSGFLSATCLSLAAHGGGSRRGRQGFLGSPTRAAKPLGLGAQRSEGNCDCRGRRGNAGAHADGRRDRGSTARVHASLGKGAGASPVHSLQPWAGLNYVNEEGREGGLWLPAWLLVLGGQRRDAGWAPPVSPRALFPAPRRGSC